MQKWLETYVRDVLDESDEILHIKYQLIYIIGGQQQIDGGAERWKIIQSVLHLVKNMLRMSRKILVKKFSIYHRNEKVLFHNFVYYQFNHF
jgi:hypothetical protein